MEAQAGKGEGGVDPTWDLLSLSPTAHSAAPKGQGRPGTRELRLAYSSSLSGTPHLSLSAPSAGVILYLTYHQLPPPALGPPQPQPGHCSSLEGLPSLSIPARVARAKKVTCFPWILQFLDARTVERFPTVSPARAISGKGLQQTLVT